MKAASHPATTSKKMVWTDSWGRNTLVLQECMMYNSKQTWLWTKWYVFSLPSGCQEKSMIVFRRQRWHNCFKKYNPSHCVRSSSILKRAKLRRSELGQEQSRYGYKSATKGSSGDRNVLQSFSKWTYNCLCLWGTVWCFHTVIHCGTIKSD